MPRIFSEADRGAIRQSLIEAGRESFLRHGLRKTSVEELARSAGIAKGTFYNFFASKEDLCMAIFDQEERAMASDLTSIVDSHRGTRETVRALLAYSLEFTRRDSLLALLREIIGPEGDRR